ncbi:hypothetical protein [Protaetiibacter larvae]|uniref:Uncharacterized protein n=1 Tax=Protaetiibacter larvae TaxID=2592654 RepID=A0A5C1Y515_9MICO|nr:hypothetical protein [Protaetiibacter larvae]QEO08866.1 hypothetical protein FLP23_01825 [Protaetiibacter larvae]
MALGRRLAPPRATIEFSLVGPERTAAIVVWISHDDPRSARAMDALVDGGWVPLEAPYDPPVDARLPPRGHAVFDGEVTAILSGGLVPHLVAVAEVAPVSREWARAVPGNGVVLGYVTDAAAPERLRGISALRMLEPGSAVLAGELVLQNPDG